MSKGYIVVGLGFGDEGKGATTQFLAANVKGFAATVKWTGGHQCAHNVSYNHTPTPEDNFCHAQIGAGTNAKPPWNDPRPTMLTDDFIVDFHTLKKEREAFAQFCMGRRPEVLVSPGCLVTTVYERAANRIKHAMATWRGPLGKPNSSCGVGIGVTREDWHKGRAITAEDMHRHVGVLVEKLRHQRSVLLADLGRRYAIEGQIGAMSPLDRRRKYMELLEEHWPQDSESDVAYQLRDASRCAEIGTINITPGFYNLSYVFEGSQGFLLDETYGFPGHNTWSDTTSRVAIDRCRQNQLKPVVVGVLRTYMTRHGDWPHNPPWHYGDEVLKLEAHNKKGKYQGAFLAGGWNLDWLQQALKINKVDCVALNHLDADIPPAQVQRVRRVLEDHNIPVVIEGRGPRMSDRTFTEHADKYFELETQYVT